MAPALLIFDCDGVLVDTEIISGRFFARALTEAGLPTTLEDCLVRYRGRSNAACMRLIEDALGRPLPEGWLADAERQLAAEFAKGIRPIPGVVAVIEAAQARGIASCVASSGSLEKMRLTLGLSGLAAYFGDRLYSASMVKHGKPAPDIFLHAAREMRAPPEACLIIEDSLPGVMAARAAEMRVLGYAGDPLTDANALAEAGASVITDMREAIRSLG